MTERERDRLAFLSSGSSVPADYIDAYYGVTWPLTGELGEDFANWRTDRPRRANCSDIEAPRNEFEAFMQQKDLMPKKWMAARLGMQVDSLENVLGRLRDLQMRPQRYNVYPDLIAKSLPEDLARNLPGLRFLVFSDHNAFCERLHVDLARALGIKVAPDFCKTSDRIQDYPRQYASDFDCLTLESVSPKHQLWLDLRKPLNLRPDRCSKLYYAENREVLRPYLFGQQEPEDLEFYLQFLAELQDA